MEDVGVTETRTLRSSSRPHEPTAPIAYTTVEAVDDAPPPMGPPAASRDDKGEFLF